MIPDRELLARLQLTRAAEQELATANRLMPRRHDRAALLDEANEVARLMGNQYRKGQFGDAADVVFVDKNRRGRRPISEMTLRDRVLFRAIVNLLSESLPARVVTRISNADFKRAPIESSEAEYISKTDVVSYYEYVDHARLANELEAQTGEAPAIELLMDLLFKVMGKRVGIPQVHRSSDVLGDTYIDPVRRRMRRAGFDVTSFSDDFRIASPTLAAARTALETCAREVRSLGLTLNESKTYTYRRENYQASLEMFGEAERRLFEEGGEGLENLNLLVFSDYTDEDGTTGDGVAAHSELVTLGAGAAQPLPEDDALDVAHSDMPQVVEDAQRRAALRAWEIWLGEEKSSEQLSRPDAATTESLLSRALPVLGHAGVDAPVDHLSRLLRSEPAMTPQVAEYIKALGATGSAARSRLRAELDRIVEQPILSTWQKVWLAEACGSLRAVRGDSSHYGWLVRCVATAEPALAATAAAALARLNRGEFSHIVMALDQVGPVWRPLVMWALGKIDGELARSVCDDRIDHMIVDGVSQ
ncbi:RNA-directed DNA polymerase [Microbacterium sufflavum]